MHERLHLYAVVKYYHSIHLSLRPTNTTTAKPVTTPVASIRALRMPLCDAIPVAPPPLHSAQPDALLAIATQAPGQLDAAKVGHAYGGAGARAQQAVDEGTEGQVPAEAGPDATGAAARQRRARVPAHGEAQGQRVADDELVCGRGGGRGAVCSRGEEGAGCDRRGGGGRVDGGGGGGGV